MDQVELEHIIPLRGLAAEPCRNSLIRGMPTSILSIKHGIGFILHHGRIFPDAHRCQERECRKQGPLQGEHKPEQVLADPFGPKIGR
jgi:hypothetical protein